MTPRLRLGLACVALVVAAPPPARADEPPPPAAPAAPTPADDLDATLKKVRDAIAHDDYASARALLLEAYQADPQPSLLFALGQVELNLEHYQAAIDYYQRFEQTNPPPDQAALAEQGIGAARLQLDKPKPKPPKPQPPKPPPHREWDALDGILVGAGGVALAGAGVLFYEGNGLSENRAGTLAQYDHRIKQAHVAQLVGITSASVGVVAIAAGLLRYQLRRVDASVAVDASPTRVGFVVELRR